MHGKRILIVCNYFAPDNAIAAVRVTKLAKYLYKNGYKVLVIAEDKKREVKDEILEKDAEGIKVIWVQHSKNAEKINARYKKLIAPIKTKKYDNLDNRVSMNFILFKQHIQ